MFARTSWLVALLWLAGGVTFAAPANPPEGKSEGAPRAPASVEEAVAGVWRSESFRARDAYRHPRQTLEFFGVTPEDTVVEVWPGTGWYTEILAPLLKEHGKYIAASVGFASGDSAAYRNRLHQALVDKIASDPNLYGSAQVAVLSPPDQTTIGAPASADVVLTFRNVHNWLQAGTADAMFAAFFTVLKSGGTLGIVEHRATPGTSIEAMKKSGYVTEDLVIGYAKKAGFELVEKSEINANPRDTKDYPEGVWTLPPTLRLKDQDKAKYLAIGESDRMTLKFRKP